jgi:SAM-dependent methyltransferase
MPSGQAGSFDRVAGDLASRSYGTVFDTIAAEYDRHRPTYPGELIDHACRAGGLAPGDRVLEIGCGTGQLTRSLAWLGGQNLARRYAGPLFTDVEIAVAPMFTEQSAEELNGLLRTLSFTRRLTPDQREALEQANREAGGAARSPDPLQPARGAGERTGRLIATACRHGN